ncbi:type III-B CRISPR module RAMP protein Cmr1 [Thermoactinomyces vulgaris]|jgi:CRISPR-associated protein Cmr1|uniref:Type III-B CRISPR module RAMP protein Cmr1 n=3 Tax=Thermoactinomyces vulgaris TaxID=2026 RepID=A0ABS0QEM6_THEVU|nr:type III-B CRISPR module RAMP protein Cmr1 [Thermoactinomyces vulgaris]MBA4595501.1 type III-B CRISPR module RAMP protein Cmr1 [Thermoactinomyces vulgaris]MBH8587714.1 type III-B CRISPR module RAMP protein Cmr1 [Thermoactinomyces vulgaris]RMB03868.1 CRISPR type III-B/RAMP module RAMP protein Cmr1 [Thermoactinomyces vulgaris]
MKHPRITARFRVMTPLKLHGAYNKGKKPIVELRIPSIKGALRYWYRAANPHYKKTVEPLGITQEEYLFGGANGKAGQSAFLMRFLEKPKGKGNSDFYKDKSFEIEFLLRPNFKQGKKPDPDWRGLLASIWLLGHFGGVGAKVRRGYGMIALEKWEAKNCEKLQSMIDNDFPILHNAKSFEDWEENLTRCWNNFVVNCDPNDEQSHTILDHHSSLFVSVVNDKCADDVRKTADNIIKNFCSKNKRNAVIFGLPKRTQGGTLEPKDKEYDRTPSPVWLRVFQVKQRYHSAFLFLTTQFPKELHLRKKRNRQTYFEDYPPVDFAGAIQSFKDQLKEEHYRRVCGYE